MNYSRRQLEAFGEPLGESVTRLKPGGRIYGGGGSKTPAQTSQTNTTDLPAWAKPHAKEILARGQALSNAPYEKYGGDRTADFGAMQKGAMEDAKIMGPAAQLGTATNLAGDVGRRAMGTNYEAGQFANQFQAPDAYQAGQFNPANVQAQGLQQYQMGPAERVRTQSFARPGAAESFMSPYMQNVVDVQQRQAQRQADVARTGRSAQAVGAGAFGGSRQAIMESEAARNLAQQKGDIQAQGLQSAYGQAQQQFNAEQQARLQAQQANQQAGLTVGGQNLGALLGVQQFGAGQNLQAQLANQQMGLNAQQMYEQSRQFGAGQGLQAAGLGAQYGQAAQQLGEQSRQYGAGLGMQGLQTALQSAGQLGQLGGQQFQQGMDINKLRSAYGGMEQGQRQRDADIAYQNSVNQQSHPYKQVGFYSDLLRGTPTGSSSVTNMYQPQGSGLQDAAGVAMGMYGLSKYMAEGGLTRSYADGGSVTSENNIANIINKLSPEQLQQAKEAALNRRDVQTAEMIDARLAELAQAKSLSAGLGSAFDQIEPEQQEAMMAGGGIVAFANRGLVDDEDEDAPSMDLAGLMGATEGNPAAYKQVTSMFPALMARVANAQYTPMTDTQYNDAITKRRKALEDGAGPSPYADYETRLKNMEAEDAKGLNQAKGIAALQAAGAMLQGSNAIRGLGAAGSAFAGAYGQALQADKAQKRSMMNMRLNLADAQRKERMGLTRDAISAADQARKDHDAAQQFGIKKSQALAAVAGKFAQATKPVKGTGTGGGPKPLKINEQLADAEVKFENDPTPANEKRVIALRRAVDRTKTSDVGPTKAGIAEGAIDEPTRREALKALNEFKMSRTRKRDWNAMVTKHGSEKAASEAFIRDYDPTKAAAPAATPTPAPAAKSVLPLGTTTGKFVQGKGTEVLKDGKVIGYAN